MKRTPPPFHPKRRFPLSRNAVPNPFVSPSIFVRTRRDKSYGTPLLLSGRMPKRNRPSKEVTLAQDVYHYLNKDEVNASRLVENAIREYSSEDRIRQAARNAGMSNEEIDEAQRS